MFNLNRYATCGVVAEIPDETQIFLWMLIDGLKAKGVTLDYLQIFKLAPFGGLQKIEHTQEQPPYSNTHVLATTEPLVAKIYVIDDGDHCTMLLAEEY